MVAGNRTAPVLPGYLHHKQYHATRRRTRNQYRALLATLRLKQAAGILNREDLAHINEWLITQPE